MQSTIISLKDQTDKPTLNVDETFWPLVQFVAYYSQLIEIKMKMGITHRFLHYWAYEVIQSNDDHTEEQRQEIYKFEGCSYRFPKDSDDFIKWLYDESKKRDLLLF
ncbi:MULTISPECIES: hypothetical protein [unclassified Sporosarcina]|uniref:hypothetical protein n=1 Tax=unclassified Sporosarcina TaxID=2647733 RepID=UPI0016477C94|nr:MULTISPECIES: hypothetical protein [unclassified Sporosarcina]MBO0589608.1 hypothetical protein [Sporosarcina sp. E16_8]MBO0603517.1 hypothetical protein [Sporosarcina sp. E16_3]